MISNLKGAAFWEKDESGKKHLYFVISTPDINNKVLVVNITDKNNKPACYDNSCELDIGDHAAISKPSVVFYMKARELNVYGLFDGVDRTDNLLDDILQKIQNGAKNSKLFPKKLRQHFKYF